MVKDRLVEYFAVSGFDPKQPLRVLSLAPIEAFTRTKPRRSFAGALPSMLNSPNNLFTASYSAALLDSVPPSRKVSRATFADFSH